MGRRMRKRLKAGYTVEAAGVMSAVLLTVMILLSSAFRIHNEVLEAMKLHTSVEQARHGINATEEKEVRMQVETGSKTLMITAPVFRPEDSLRMWSLLEGEG